MVHHNAWSKFWVPDCLTHVVAFLVCVYARNWRSASTSRLAEHALSCKHSNVEILIENSFGAPWET